jgi:hypothetical protein
VLYTYNRKILYIMLFQCLSPLMLRVRILLRRGVLDTTLCDKVCQWFATCRWFSPGTPVSSTNNTDRHDITEIVLKVTLNTIYKPNIAYYSLSLYLFLFSFIHSNPIYDWKLLFNLTMWKVERRTLCDLAHTRKHSLPCVFHIVLSYLYF